MSSSSYGLQPYKIIIVENPELRAQIQPVAWGQSQIVDASHLLIFANETNIGDETIDGLLKAMSETRGTPMEALAGYGDFMKSKISILSAEAKPFGQQSKPIWL